MGGQDLADAGLLAVLEALTSEGEGEDLPGEDAVALAESVAEVVKEMAEGGGGEQFATAPEEWAPYQGPHGGRGWRNARTGKVLYQVLRPGSHPAAEPKEAPSGDRVGDPKTGASAARNIKKFLDGDAEFDFARLPPSTRQKLVAHLATNPGGVVKLFAAHGPDIVDPAGMGFEDKDHVTNLLALRDVLYDALEAMPQQPAVDLSPRNVERSWVLDLSKAEPSARNLIEKIAGVFRPAKSLTGRDVRVVFAPRGVTEDEFRNFLDAVEPKGMSSSDIEDMTGELYKSSVAPEQVAVTDAPQAARGLDQSDAADFHADNVTTYKRISKDFWLRCEPGRSTAWAPGGGSQTRVTYDIELVGRGEVPELTAIPKALLDRKRENTGVTRDRADESGADAAERIKGHKERVAAEGAAKDAAKKAAKEERAAEVAEAQRVQASEAVQGWADDALSNFAGAVPSDEEGWDDADRDVADSLKTLLEETKTFDGTPEEAARALREVVDRARRVSAHFRLSGREDDRDMADEALRVAAAALRKLRRKGKKRARGK